jgi:hypothetical protein
MTPKQYQEQATPEYFKKQMPAKMAEQRANELGISKDDMFKLYSSITQSGSPVQGMPGGSPYGSNAMQWTPTSTTGPGGTVTTASPLQQQAAQMLQQKKVADAMGWFQPPQQQQAQQPQIPQLAPAQQMPTVQTTALKATTPYGNIGPQQQSPATPAASAQNITPMFNPMQQPQLGVQPLQPGQYAPPPLPTLPSYQPQPQWFQSGGLVTGDQQQNPQGANIQPSSQASNTGIYNPSYLGSYLGALALGQPMIVNPQPSGTPSAKSGTSPVGGPQYYSTGGGSFQLPSGDILTQDQMNALDPGSIRELQRGVGLGTVKYLTPQQAGPAAQGPWAQMPGIFKKADMPTIGGTGVTQLTATPQANAALMPKAGPAPTYAPQVSTPMPAGVNVGGAPQLTPPPAPSVATSGVAVGGPPPVQARPTVINDPRMSQAVSNLLGIQVNPWHHEDGSSKMFPVTQPPLRASGASETVPLPSTHPWNSPSSASVQQLVASAGAKAPPKKMQSGGVVHGQPGPDQVPAMLTAGEFVMNKDAVKNIGVGNLQSMNRQRFDDGGEVMPREAKHKVIGTDSQGSPQSSSQPSPGTPGAARSILDNMTAWGTRQGPAGSGYAARTEPNYLETRSDPDPDTGYLQQAGYSPGQARDIASAYSGQSPGNMPGVGGVTPNQASAIGGIASGISQAVQTWANSIKPWQMQPSAIPDPRSFQRPQQTTLSQETET